MENQKVEKEITLRYLFDVLKKSAIVMIIAAVVLGALAGMYGVFIQKPSYKCTATFWVNNTSPNYDYTSQAQTAAAIALSSSCVELAATDMPVREAVVTYGLTEKLGFENENDCVKAVRSMISAYKSDENSIVFYITISSGSREASYEAMSALQQVMPGTLDKLCGLKENETKAPMITVISPVNSIDDVQQVKSSPVKLALVGALAAAVIVYVIYFVISIFDKSIYGESSIKENFDYPVLGNIPTLSNGNDNKIFISRKNSQSIPVRNYQDRVLSKDSPFFLTEAFNTLRTNVVFAVAGAKNPVLAVTSDVAGAGKTIVSANLAISLANLGKKVLFVECDLRCPALSKVFSKKKDVGLSELLAGMIETTEEAIIDIGKPNLDVIFAGKIPPNPSELLSGYKMADLIKEWKEKYDYVILDTPPIGEVFDAGVLSTLVNGYIVTARCNFSNLNGIKLVAERIGAVDGNLLGVIVNDSDPKNANGGKYYYSNYSRYAKAAEEVSDK
ncbi:MAG: polysaccharide biosynthesis tyrosine autokinase [Clostridia bacterium]|nr:polysaccharide biosynthesis tyrosine autokinase [Clostridia bacterium]